MQNYLIKNLVLINEGKKFHSDILLKNGRIEKIDSNISVKYGIVEIDGANQIAIPGVIDDQVHFREPGYVHKADIESESKAALAGGVTSYMEMPNTNPPTTTLTLLNEKKAMASKKSWVNYSFYLGATEGNIEEIKKANEHKGSICGVKVFMGSSTGNLLVSNPLHLNEIFRESNLLVATHCESELLIKNNLEKYQDVNKITIDNHPNIRNEEVCFSSSLLAVQLAKKHNTRLHVLHISTAKEIELFGNMIPLSEKLITSEVCVHHLHFTAADYPTKGNLIKCNPAIKSVENKQKLWQALLNGNLDVIATDHAPHTWVEKAENYYKAPAGLPLIQHGLFLMTYYIIQEQLSWEILVEKMCHNPAICYKIENRGFIREGYYADLVILKKNEWQVSKENILYKVGWSPFEGFRFPYQISHCFVNGQLALHYDKFCKVPVMSLTFKN